MQHRGEPSFSTSETESLLTEQSIRPLIDAPGRHRQSHRNTGPLVIPTQKTPPREVVEDDRPVEPLAPAPSESREAAVLLGSGLSELAVPASAQWTARHLSRLIAAGLLVLCLAGTVALGARYWQSGDQASLASLVVGLFVVLTLWAALIVSTPQVITLAGSVLTVHSGRGSERFDLGDPMSQIDVVGTPGSSTWAVLLRRRGDEAALVLRRGDVEAKVFDPIARHYRALSERLYRERAARFDA